MSKKLYWKAALSLPVLISITLGGATLLSNAREQVAQSPSSSPNKIFLAQHSGIVNPQRVYNRVWEIIKDEYYLQDYNHQNWDRWKHKYDGKLKTLDDSHKAVETMLASLGDRYTRFLDRDAFDDEKAQIDARLCGVGIQIGMDKSQRIIVIAPIDDTPASHAGVMPGDEIAEVDGKSTKGMSVDEAAKIIKGQKDTEVILTLVRKSERLKLKMVRDEIHIHSIPTAKMLDGDVGYIRLTSFISHDANKEMQQALNSLAKAKGIILDLRDNPGGLLTNAIEISNMFLDAKSNIVSTVDKDGYKTPAMADGKPVTHQALIVLINKGSASASEIASGALKDNGRATLVGQKSFGKGLVQGITRLEDGSGVNYTIARYLTPSDTDIHNKGISPDILVELTNKDYEDGKGPWWLDPDGPGTGTGRKPEDLKDIQLKKAVDTIKQQLEEKKVALGKTQEHQVTQRN